MNGKAHPVVVRRPREYDAIGFALRDAFAQDFGLPSDMAAALSRLDLACTKGSRCA